MPLTQQIAEDKLPEIVRRLVESLQPSTIYLFGSVAAGRPGPDSDIDLLVVLPQSSLSFYQRAAVAYRRGAASACRWMFWSTRVRSSNRATLPVSFERTVCQRGRVLYAA